MTIAFIVDYPLAGDRAEWSGAEVSISLLTETLISQGMSIVTVVPAEARYNKTRKLHTPLFTNSPWWHIYSAWEVWKSLHNKNIDVIHIHGKNNLLGAFLANLFLQKKIIATVRDYRFLCDLGMCLLFGNKSCGWNEYLFRDIPFFIRHYHTPNLANYLYTYLSGLYQLLQRPLNLFILKHLDKVVCISREEEKVYHLSNIHNTTVIYNPVNIYLSSTPRQKQVFFGGRYTLGKGREILDGVVPEFLKNHRDWKFVLAGLGNGKPAGKQIVDYGQVSYKKYLHLASQSWVAVVPSVWVEPFGRAALDAISVGTPVVASDRGGLKEIIDNGTTGLVVSPTRTQFASALEEAVKQAPLWQKNIFRKRNFLKEKFSAKPIRQHINLYESLLK